MRLLLMMFLASAPLEGVVYSEDAPPAAARSSLPNDARIVAAVFENLAVAFHPDQGCKAGDKECTVGEFLQKTLVFKGHSIFEPDMLDGFGDEFGFNCGAFCGMVIVCGLSGLPGGMWQMVIVCVITGQGPITSP